LTEGWAFNLPWVGGRGKPLSQISKWSQHKANSSSNGYVNQKRSMKSFEQTTTINNLSGPCASPLHVLEYA
jgi:hypothetical protein